MKPSFSLLEIIISIVILSIISSLAVYKLFYTVSSSNVIKVQSEIALIRSTIDKNYGQRVMLGEQVGFIEQLDDANINQENQNLFTGYNEYVLLDDLIISTSKEKKKLASWIKTEINSYEIFLDKNSSVEFIYDNQKGTFTCNTLNTWCKELAQ